MELEDAEETAQIRWKPRVLDFVTLDGLQRFTGCTPERFVQFIVKELIDNALDKENVHNIEAGVILDDDGVLVFVADDGKPKFTEESLNKILDFQNAPSSKRGIKRIQRGVLGNALQCCFGISHALWKEENRPEYIALVKGKGCWIIALKVENDNIKPLIQPLPNLEDVKNCTVETSLRVQNFKILQPIALENLPPTVIWFLLPRFNYESPIEVVKHIATVNPYVNIKYQENPRSINFKALPEASPPILSSNFGDIWWYDFDDFKWLAREFSRTKVKKFVLRFKKFSSMDITQQLLENGGIDPVAPVGSIGEEKLKLLFNKMREKTKPSSPRTLPIVGPEAFRRRGGSKYAIKRGVVNAQGKQIPYVFEAAKFPSIFKEKRIIECINFTTSLYSPFSRWAWSQSDGKKMDLYDLIKNSNENMLVLVHFVCPNITWLSPSKGEMANLDSFKEPLFSVVKNVAKTNTAIIDENTIIESVLQILKSMPNFKFTLRQIFYRLVAHYGYPNTKHSYSRLSKILTVARDEQIIDPERIVDLTRPEYFNNPKYQTLEGYKAEKIQEMTDQFDLDRWESQQLYVEVWIEKEALSRVILPVCKKYRVNLIVGRGYSSSTQVYKASKRFPEGKPSTILYLGDFDPPGLHIEEKLLKRLRRQLSKTNENSIENVLERIMNLKVERVALTYDQARIFSLPPSPLKKYSQKYREYMELYGNDVWELDALEPQILINLLEGRIKQLINWEIWEKREKEVEEKRNQLKQEIMKAFPTMFSK